MTDSEMRALALNLASQDERGGMEANSVADVLVRAQSYYEFLRGISLPAVGRVKRAA